MEGQPGEVGGLQALEFVAGTIVSMVSGGARPGKAGRHASFLHKTDPWQAWLATRHPTPSPPHPTA